jgi:HEAT repeat protein
MAFSRIVKWFSAASLVAGLAVATLGTEAFAASKAAEAKKAIADLAAAKDAKAKAAALEDLGKIAQVQKSLVEPALADIKKSLADSSATVRKAAATAYGRCDPDPKEAVPLLTALLKDKDDDVKTGAANGLMAMGPSAYEALPAIKDAMRIEKEKSKDKNQTKLGRELGDAAKAIGAKKKN